MKDTKLNDLRDQFARLDSNGDGRVSADELGACLAQVGITKTQSDVQRIVASVDANRSGTIAYTEFVAATLDRQIHVDRSACWTAFNVVDIDGNGSISDDELGRLLGLKSGRRGQAKELIQLVDSNGDGVIDFEEFLQFMVEGDGIIKGTPAQA
mmetsp:Transcript_13662/g.44275  ORF Transcript_13662/g.44275 Transcript_13662/m.44275 type:complete len:154 (+) Transcript_13662:1-462(+)